MLNDNRQHKWSKYRLNENYFDKINTGNKAYFLGFLYADGCNDMSTIKIQLSECDKDILIKLKKEIGSNSPITKSAGRSIKFKTDKKSYKQKDSCTLKLHSKYLCKSLCKAGCMPRKTFSLIFPNPKILPLRLIRHFIRGYFDGDGSLSVPKNKKGCYFYFIGRKNFCLKVKTILEKNLNIQLTFRKYKKHSFWTIHCGSIPNIQKILKFLYTDATVFLNRKHNKYKDFVKYKYTPYIKYNFKFNHGNQWTK